MTDQKTIDFINEELAEWGDLVTEILVRKIGEKGLIMTSELARSLNYEVLKAAASQQAEFRLHFQDIGRIKDIRQLRYKKQPPIKVIEEWVRAQGLSSFKDIPGYTGSGKTPTESRAINRIAWGISRSRLNKNKRKPVKWFSKTFYGMINVLIDSLLKGYQEQAAGAVTDSLKGM